MNEIVINKIIITKRTHDYHAHLEGYPGIWDCGKTSNEAIGNLIRTHASAFNIEVTDI